MLNGTPSHIRHNGPLPTNNHTPTGRRDQYTEPAGVDDQGEEREEEEGGAGAAAATTGGPGAGAGDLEATAEKVPEMVARAWERTRRQRALESHVKGACCVFGCGWGYDELRL